MIFIQGKKKLLKYVADQYMLNKKYKVGLFEFDIVSMHNHVIFCSGLVFLFDLWVLSEVPITAYTFKINQDLYYFDIFKTQQLFSMQTKLGIFDIRYELVKQISL